MGGVGKDSTGILVLAATNIPWALDTAILRRFNIKVHIGLPDASARAELFKLAIGEAADKLTKEDFRELAQASDGFSGSDIANVVDSAVNKPIQLSMHATHFRPVSFSSAEIYALFYQMSHWRSQSLGSCRVDVPSGSSSGDALHLPLNIHP